MAELILSGVARKETVELDVPGPKARPIVLRLEASDRDRHASSALIAAALPGHQLTKRFGWLARLGNQFGHLGERVCCEL